MRLNERAPRQLRDIQDLRAIRVLADCGGGFSPFEEGASGAELRGWVTNGPSKLPGSWERLDGPTAPAESISPGSASTGWKVHLRYSTR